MIVKRRIIIKESKYKRELTTISRNSNLSVCEFYKCKYRDVDRRCVDRKKNSKVEIVRILTSKNLEGVILLTSSYTNDC